MKAKIVLKDDFEGLSELEACLGYFEEPSGGEPIVFTPSMVGSSTMDFSLSPGPKIPNLWLKLDGVSRIDVLEEVEIEGKKLIKASIVFLDGRTLPEVYIHTRLGFENDYLLGIVDPELVKSIILEHGEGEKASEEASENKDQS
jgi:hypothetical protein